MIRSITLALGLLLFMGCETTPSATAGQGAAISRAANDEPATTPRRREPCGDGPVMLPGDPPRQTGVVTSTGEPID